MRTILVCLLAAAATAQGPSPTWLHEVLLDRAPVVVRARFLRIDPVSGPAGEIAVHQLVRALAGRPQGSLVRVVGLADRARSLPHWDKLLFLKPMSSGLLYQLVDVVDIGPEDDPAAELLVKGLLEAGSNQDAKARKDQRFKVAMEALATRSVFATRVAANELERLLKDSPGLFTRSVLARVEAVSATIPRDAAADHRRLVDRLGSALSSPWAGADLSFAPGEERELFHAAKQRFEELRDEPERQAKLLSEMAEAFGPKLLVYCRGLLGSEHKQPVRTMAIRWLGEFGRPEAIPTLLEGWPDRDDAEIALRVTALGQLGARAAVPKLEPLLRQEALQAVAAEALARIGDGPSQKALAALRADLRDGPMRARIDEYLSDAFRVAELERRLKVAQRWR